MHFDLRTIGVGKMLCEKIGGFVPKTGHPSLSESETDLENEDYFDETAEYIDESEFHEAIAESEWGQFEDVETETLANEATWEAEQVTDRLDMENYWETETEPEIDEESYYGWTPVKDWSKAISLNRQYASSLGWNQYITEINNLLLPYSGMNNVSLGEEALAQAIAAWQKEQGLLDDGIMGPNTWNKMQPALFASPAPTSPPAWGPSPVPTTTAPSVQNVFEFNRWHAQKILDRMNGGIIGQNFSSKSQLESIVKGSQVLNVNPNSKIIQSLPIMYHIAEQAAMENYREILFGSFIRGASAD